MAPGELIDGKYMVERTLGHGGMGVVVAARHVHIGTPVAIKLMQPDARSDLAKRLLREARTCSRLRGAHVTQVFDAGTHDGRPYLVMELLAGRDLASMLDDTSFEPHVACAYVMQACEGLGEAHALGLVHRDIKPANLFLTTAGTIKVLDFGIATAMDGDIDEQLTGVHEVMGSPGYMSPEQLRGIGELDVRSDVWSLGITLYELISGRHAFEGENLAELMHAIAYDPHAPLHEASRELAAVVDRCLEKDPAKRYADTRELAWALAPFAADPALARPRYFAPIGDLVAVRGIRVLPAHAAVLELPPLPSADLARGSRNFERQLSRHLFRPRTIGAVAALALLMALVGFVGAGGEVAPASITMRPAAAEPVVATPIETAEPVYVAPTPAPAPERAPTITPKRGAHDFVFAPTPAAKPPAKRHRRTRR